MRKLNACDFIKRDESNKVVIFYWNEMSDNKFLDRCYLVETTQNGTMTSKTFGDKSTAQNKTEAFAHFYKMGELLETK